MTNTISIYKWAKREGMPISTACWLRDSGKLPVVRRKKIIFEVPENITKDDLVKA
jgi:hypothetical protein